jgi:hypothetical protein
MTTKTLFLLLLLLLLCVTMAFAWKCEEICIDEESERVFTELEKASADFEKNHENHKKFLKKLQLNWKQHITPIGQTIPKIDVYEIGLIFLFFLIIAWFFVKMFPDGI